MEKYYKYINIIVVLIFSGYLLGLAISGFLKFYISSRYFLFNTTMTLLLIGYLVGWGILNRKRLTASISHILEHLAPQKFIYLLPFIIFVVVIFLPPAALSREAVISSRSIRAPLDFSAETRNEYLDTSSVLETENYTIYDWVRIFGVQTDLEKYHQNSVDVTGLIFYPDNNDLLTRFNIGRFVITCCTVDATPVALTVENLKADDINWIDRNVSSNSWYRIQGEFNYDEEKNELILVPSTVEPVEPPDDPYQ